MSRILVVTGTDTGVGKTIATASLARAYAASGLPVHVDKPVQTGVGPEGGGDVAEIARLAGRVGTSEGIRMTEPMAPVPAAAIDGIRLPSLDAQVDRLRLLADTADVLLIEGAGGLLVRLDEAGATIADVATGLGAPLIVVTRAGLGTLNHTELTLEALARRGLSVAGLIIGAWPAHPGAIERSNREHLAGLGVPLLGALPDGAGALSPAEFGRQAPGWLALDRVTA
ncbi:MAG: dethiobiotin synthase [Dermatophilaceae bacterium]